MFRSLTDGHAEQRRQLAGFGCLSDHALSLACLFACEVGGHGKKAPTFWPRRSIRCR